MDDSVGRQSRFQNNFISALGGVIVLAGLYASSLYSYNLFHSIAELFSVIVAVGIFMVAWNSRGFLGNNNYLLFLGIAYLFVAGVDLVHTLAYKGMGVFVGYGANLPTQLWLVARYLESTALLIAPFFVARKLNGKLAFAVYAVITAVLLGTIFYWDIFPTAFVEGVGLTPFKVVSEYAISAVLLLAIIPLIQRRKSFESDVLSLIIASILVTVAEEMSFTLYTDPYGFTNLLGHFLKIISFYLIYKAIIETGLVRPYGLLFRELKQTEEAVRESEEKYRRLFNNSNEGIVVCDLVYDDLGRPIDYVIKDVNPGFERIVGATREQVIDRMASSLYETGGAHHLDTFARVAQTGIPESFEAYLPQIKKYFSISAFSADVDRFAIVFIDITERKIAEQELRSSKELSDALNSIDALLSSTLDVGEVMQQVLLESAKAVGAETAAIALHEDGQWIVRYTYGFPNDLTGMGFADEDMPHAMMAARARKAVVINDVEHEEMAGLKSVKEFGIRSVMVVPLIIKEEILGAIFFNHNSQTTIFTRVQVDFVNKLSLAISLALENTRLYKAERNIADTLQAAILKVPNKIPGIDFSYLYRSATVVAKIGGDFYDFFELDSGKVGFMIGDVSGKGIEAAAVTSVVKSTARAFAYRNNNPSYVLSETNNAISKQVEAGLFITMLYGTIDISSGRLTMSSAGHPDPFICRPTGCTLEVARRNPPLGIFPDTGFESFETKLSPGDSVVLYTDGLVEARRDSELLGDERVRQTLDGLNAASPDEIVSSLLSLAIEFSSDQLSDDMALVAFRYEGNLVDAQSKRDVTSRSL
ncbi:MAG: SpoIIE family protein phosphatase [Firmicutes bacterium]|nr:SpoIIE family protein phosphatase [Bacillota bacterium]